MEKHEEDRKQSLLLARLDERTARIEKDVEDIKREVSSKYVTRVEFETVRRIVYGIVTIILVGFAGALVNLVIRQ